MKVALGLVACLLLSSPLAAAADAADRPRFKPSGEPCTAEEIANPPVVKVAYRGRTFDWKVVCRTKGEWRLMRSAQSDYERDLARWERDSLNLSSSFVDMPKRPSSF